LDERPEVSVNPRCVLVKRSFKLTALWARPRPLRALHYRDKHQSCGRAISRGLQAQSSP